MTRQDWYDMDEEKFTATFAHSPIKRAKFAGLKRNLEFIKDRRIDKTRDWD